MERKYSPNNKRCIWEGKICGFGVVILNYRYCMDRDLDSVKCLLGNITCACVVCI